MNSKFGQPDSIVENYDHCQHLFDDEYELVYRGGLKFHLKNDSIIAESIKLNEGIRLIYNDLLFDKETTLQEFSILFTQAFERREVVDIDDYPYGNNLTLLKFKENMDALDYVICFFFKDGKLFYVARLFPC
ncbi:hypothetical protein JCM15548_11460 [Geofilum rubicundum JCM 15548]|uniref:Uncharacterized protein n=1 Tax=Geofilum rubicundum JCM 15548 TaxID=1236989 RepID=A0A0E9LUM0_9BACT|nr:hypothetical protein JCM15548_11460 [Geofilum rubicundum JCM 15548]